MSNSKGRLAHQVNNLKAIAVSTTGSPLIILDLACGTVAFVLGAIAKSD
ncbi:MAG: hypothetical protein IGS49_19265 [Chlorogloeopsis fritschii C42_A2020_084]|nr:hypothetical protein [Chlorogloeopsis fritschii]MBF2007533.1 hypothetical protein [Chlorogloeopsis fritschii C42_A2020_084]